MSNSLWQSWGTSVIGPMHIKKGISNQDSWMSRQYKWGNVVVVSDGLGSKPHADHGSRAACLAVFETAKTYKHNRHAEIKDILRLIHANWLVKISPFSPYDCSSTCLFAIQIEKKMILGQLGDGLITVHGDLPEKSFILNNRNPEFFSNMTYCLTGEFKYEQWKSITIKTENCNSVILCTDGISDDLKESKELDFTLEVAEHYKKHNARTRVTEIKKWLKEWPVPHHSDDKTIACLYRKEVCSE